MVPSRLDQQDELVLGALRGAIKIVFHTAKESAYRALKKVNEKRPSFFSVVFFVSTSLLSLSLFRLATQREERLRGCDN